MDRWIDRYRDIYNRRDRERMKMSKERNSKLINTTVLAVATLQ